MVREAAGEEDADLIKTENLAATTEYSQTPRYRTTWIPEKRHTPSYLDLFLVPSVLQP